MLNESFYLVDKEELTKVRKAKVWNAGSGTEHPKYFNKVKCSAAAAVKMLQHAMRGVEKGMKSKNGMRKFKKKIIVNPIKGIIN